MMNTRTWRDFVDARYLAKNRNELADYLRFHDRFPSEDDQVAIKQHLQKLSKDAVVIHFDDARQAASVLEQGRFYSALEQNSMPLESVVNCVRTEAVLFGERPPDAPGIIYATLGNTGNHGYGNVAICLKNSVKPRATVTRKDSLNAMTGCNFDPVGGLCVANGFDDLDCLVVPLRMGEDILSATCIEDLSMNSYFEVQIHGGVSAHDIKRISAPRGAVTHSLREQARNKGIIIEEQKP
jgi:hypothetical protein